MLNICRLKISDYWIYPQPIRPGDWRACKARPYNRPIQRQHIKPNRFAWKLRQSLFDYIPDSDFSGLCRCEDVCRFPGATNCSYEAGDTEYNWDHIESGAYLDYSGDEDD